MSITNYLWTMLVLYVLAILSYAREIAGKPYVPPSAGVRAFAFVLNVFLAAWLVYLLARLYA